LGKVDYLSSLKPSVFVDQVRWFELYK